MKKASKLKPLLACPFCGGEANLIEADSGHFYIMCCECTAKGEPFYHSEPKAKDNAIKAWNKRAR